MSSDTPLLSVLGRVLTSGMLVLAVLAALLAAAAIAFVLWLLLDIAVGLQNGTLKWC